MNYIIEYTKQFSDWMDNLKDRNAKVRIKIRLDRILAGHFGDYKSLGGGLYELRIPTGKGYRVYYTIKNNQIVIVLAGGHKGTQKADIAKAKEIIKE